MYAWPFHLPVQPIDADTKNARVTEASKSSLTAAECSQQAEYGQQPNETVCNAAAAAAAATVVVVHSIIGRTL